MNVQHQACDPKRIERLLAHELSGEERAALESHLEVCSTCRETLDAMTADPSWWREARDFLSGTGPPLMANGDSPVTGDDYTLKNFLAPTDDPRMLGRVGPYEIAGIIGCGGMGIVLKGFDPALNRYVAIKLLDPRLAVSATARRRFAREAQAAATVMHDNVMAIHAVAEAQGLPYFVMPYARGASLEKRIQQTGPLGLEEILRVGLQVAAGLAAAHAQGLVHRDIKPANILLEEGVERVKITDFGLARAIDDASLTRSGVIAGTPQYMSPEQARGEPIDHRTDLFSLGCVLYAACTGRSPFRAETSYGVLRKICDSEPRDVRESNPVVPAWLVRIVNRLLAKEPSQRYGSAADVADLFQRCLAHVQQPANVPLPVELIDRARWGASLPRIGPRGAVAAAILLLAVGLLAWQQRSPSQQAQRVENSRSATTAPAARPRSATPWEDGIGDGVDSLRIDVDRLRHETTDLLWNDSLGRRIESLTKDVEHFAIESATVDDSTPSPKPVKEAQP